MITNKTSCEVATHYNKSHHTLNDFEFTCIEQIISATEVETKLLKCEAFWMTQLHTLHPYDLNKRNESNSTHRISFNK